MKLANRAAKTPDDKKDFRLGAAILDLQLDTNDQKTRVFVSYSRKNADFADKLVVVLRQRGYRSFLDRKDIVPARTGGQGSTV